MGVYGKRLRTVEKQLKSTCDSLDGDFDKSLEGRDSLGSNVKTVLSCSFGDSKVVVKGDDRSKKTEKAANVEFHNIDSRAYIGSSDLSFSPDEGEAKTCFSAGGQRAGCVKFELGDGDE